MRIALIQYQPTENTQATLKRGLEALEEAAQNGADLVAFPELAFTPFYPQYRAEKDFLDLAEPIPGPTTQAFSEAAKRLGVVVVLNLFERDGDLAYDTSPVIDADGTLLGCARMMHITDYECFYEQGYYTPGTHQLRYSTPLPAVSELPFVTTATSLNICATLPLPTPSWSSSRKPGLWTSGPRACSKPNYRLAHSTTAISWRWQIE